MALGTYRPVHSQQCIVVLKMGATAVLEGEMLMSGGTYGTATALVIVADSNTKGATGIAAASTAANALGPVYIDGVFEVTDSGTNFVPGDLAYCSGAATLDAGTMSDRAVGVICETDPASTGATRFLLQSSALGQSFLHA